MTTTSASAPGEEHSSHAGVSKGLTLGALGVVFGDIGTSPLYAMKEVFRGPHTLAVTQESVYGVLSLIFWSITIVVSLKYVLFIMRADNDGEGGIMALISLVRRIALRTTRTKYGLITLGVFGAALFYGDGMITPAISVLSAVEGLQVVAPSLRHLIIPLTLIILTSLFAIQTFGTTTVGRVFGPIMSIWFASLAIFGALQVARSPGILAALSPAYAVEFFFNHGVAAFLALGSVVLAVTGAEALYADMGHFGRRPIRRAWFAFVFPALVLNYFGQGALLLSDPSTAESPFYRLISPWAQLPMLILATMAAVIASQAVISGAFSVTRQAIRLGFLPVMNIRHTSRFEAGQVFVPAVNWGLYLAVVALVVGFRSSTALASAYGIAVTGTLAIDTILAFVVVRVLWRKPLWIVFAGTALFLTVDLAFFTANISKIVHGGWFPLVIAGVLFVLLTTWQDGRSALMARRVKLEGSLQQFVFDLADSNDPPLRVPGTAVFLSANDMTVPLALRYNVSHNHVLHSRVVVVTVETANVPHVPEDQRLTVDDLRIPDDGIALVRARFGFSDEPDVPHALRLAVEHGLDIDVDRASYFITRSSVSATGGGDMAMWRKRLFIAMNRNAGNGVRYFELPEERVVALGSSIAI